MCRLELHDAYCIYTSPSILECVSVTSTKAYFPYVIPLVLADAIQSMMSKNYGLYTLFRYVRPNFTTFTSSIKFLLRSYILLVVLKDVGFASYY
jgi:hypothetical protein